MSEDRAVAILDDLDAELVSDLWAKGVTIDEIASVLMPKARQTEQEVMRLLSLKAQTEGAN